MTVYNSVIFIHLIGSRFRFHPYTATSRETLTQQKYSFLLPSRVERQAGRLKVAPKESRTSENGTAVFVFVRIGKNHMHLGTSFDGRGLVGY